MRTKLILLSVLLASCSDFSMPSMPSGTLLTPYKMDIRQGNYITPEMREKLKLGMPRSQVRYVLGTPMISDAFHGNRWDYVYSLEHHGEIVEKQHLTLYFDGDNLVKIDDGKTVETAPAVVEPVAVKRAVEPEAPKPVVPRPEVPKPEAPKPVVPRPEVPKPEASKPEASKPEASKPVAKADPEADVLKSVQGWAAAWSAKNTRIYLATYAAEFKPDGMSRAAWEKQRLDRIGKPKVIEVALSDINVSMEDDDHATVSFTQDYRSDNYHDQVEKTLQLVNQSGHWLIAEEHVGKVVKNKAKAQADEPARASEQPVNANQQAVQDTVKRWADAWSARDTGKYLASYGTAFKPKEMSRAAWETQRKERIGKAHSIAVRVSELKIKLHDGSHASATFMQDYRSDSHKDSIRKTLLLEKTGDAWLIVAEQASK